MATSQETNTKHAKLIACHDCDTLIELPSALNANEKLCCPLCGETQLTGRKHAVDSSLALAITGLILLVLSISFPFLSMEASGVGNSITLLRAPVILLDDGYPMMAFLVLAGVMGLPAVFLIGVIIMLTPLSLGIRDKAAIFHAKILDALLPWIMADVFVIAILVALFKLMDMADMILDISFWAYLGFTLSLILLTNIVGKRQLWLWVKQGKSALEPASHD